MVENPIKNLPDLQENIQNFLRLGVKPTEKGARRPSEKQVIFSSAIVAGKSPTQALKEAGYGKSIIEKNPQIVINSRGVAECLDILLEGQDIELAKENIRIMKKSAKIEQLYFPYYPSKKKTESDEQYLERIEGLITNDEIRDLIVGLGGYVRNISNNFTAGRIAYFYFPDNQTRLKALELIYKVKGSLAPIQSTNKNININFSPSRLRAEAEAQGRDIIEEEETNG